MGSLRQNCFWFNAAAHGVHFLALISLLAMLISPPASRAEAKPQKGCIAIALPTVEGISGNALEAANGVRDLMTSYLTGPSLKVVALEAKLASTAVEEAKEKGCEPLLFVTVRHKTGSHGFMKALGQAASTSSWSRPGGGSVASATARAGAAGGLQVAASMAQSTKAKDEIS